MHRKSDSEAMQINLVICAVDLLNTESGQYCHEGWQYVNNRI